MQVAVKLLISVGIILFCTQIARRVPTLAGLITTMPLTSLIVLLWVYSDKPEDVGTLTGYCKGALFGIIPSIFFYLAAYLCLSRNISVAKTLAVSFAVWVAAAYVHQRILGC
jgi:uncharacterized membrane protein (GlpM family)